MKIKEVIEVLESFAPPALAEEWDNVGLMLGDAGQAHLYARDVDPLARSQQAAVYNLAADLCLRRLLH